MKLFLIAQFVLIERAQLVKSAFNGLLAIAGEKLRERLIFVAFFMFLTHLLSNVLVREETRRGRFFTSLKMHIRILYILRAIVRAVRNEKVWWQSWAGFAMLIAMFVFMPMWFQYR